MRRQCSLLYADFRFYQNNVLCLNSAFLLPLSVVNFFCYMLVPVSIKPLFIGLTTNDDMWEYQRLAQRT